MEKLKVLPEKCIACGKCYLNFPEVFDCHDDGIAFVLPDSTAKEQSAAQKAMFQCPTQAIQLVEETN